MPRDLARLLDSAVRRRIAVATRKLPGDQADGGIDAVKLGQYLLLREPDLGIDGEQYAVEQLLRVLPLLSELTLERANHRRS